MPLIDALRSGVDLVNASNQGVGQAAMSSTAFPMAQADLYKAQTENKYLDPKLRLANQHQELINQYYGPEHQAAIDYQNIINKYQPEKSRLGNEYQGLVNQNYTPNIQSEISARDAETKFTPLRYAIQAENAIRNNSRFGGSYQYLKAISDMPADQRSIWLANPENYQQYQDQIQEMHGAMSKGSGMSLVTPALLKRLGLEPLSEDVVGSKPHVGVVVGQATRGESPPLGGQQDGGLSAPTSIQQPEVKINPNSTNASLPSDTPPLTPIAASVQQKTGASTQEANAIANEAKNENLTAKDKQQLGFQLIANKKSVDAFTTRRAMASVTYEKLLGENQDRIEPAFENAAKYAGLLGSGKLKIDQFRQDHPKEFQDYMWVTQDLIPNLSNNVRLMEGLSSTNQQREALNDMYKVPLSWRSDPKMAVNLINKTIKLFGGQARAALETAQPIYPGVIEKLHGLKIDRNKDYIGKNNLDLSKMSDEELMKIAGGQ